MNKDFHYYATFYAAINAGFEKNMALKIAWAAEMVDELNLALANEYKHVLKDDYIVTIQKDGLEYFRDFLQDEANYNNEVAQGMRGIWVPFHFLPGHLDDENADYNKIVYKGYLPKNDTVDIRDFDPHYMDACLKLRCAPYSSTVKIMIDYFKDSIYSQEGDKWTNEALYGLGICMHILADTWSHENFCGLPSYVVNKAVLLNAKITPFTGNVYLADASYTIDATIGEWIIKNNCLINEENSSIYLGHAQIGSVPDYDFLYFKYWHRYAFGNLSSMGRPTEKHNYSIFRNALLGMYNALCFIRNNNNTIEFNLKDNSQFGAKADNVMEKVFRITPPNKLSHEEIVEYKERLWNSNKEGHLLFDELHYTIAPFNTHVIEKFGTALTFEGELRKFAHQAKMYRNYMFSYLNTQLDNTYKNKPLTINNKNYSMSPVKFNRKTVDSWLIDFRLL